MVCSIWSQRAQHRLISLYLQVYTHHLDTFPAFVLRESVIRVSLAQRRPKSYWILGTSVSVVLLICMLTLYLLLRLHLKPKGLMWVKSWMMPRGRRCTWKAQGPFQEESMEGIVILRICLGELLVLVFEGMGVANCCSRIGDPGVISQFLWKVQICRLEICISAKV